MSIKSRSIGRTHGSWRQTRIHNDMAKKRVEYAEKRVEIMQGSSALEAYRKLKPHLARMLERGTAILRKCEKCGLAFIEQRWRGRKFCWPCYSKTPNTFTEELQSITESLYKEYSDYVHQGVTVTTL